MCGFTIKIINVKKITGTLLQEIITLHKSTFFLPDDLIINSISEKETLLLYRDKHTKKLIGTVALQWLAYERCVVYYAGSVVVDNNYRRSGIFSHSQLYAALLTFLKFPFKKKFGSGFLTTSQVFSWTSKMPSFWPQEGQETPTEIMELMHKLASTIAGHNHYRIENGIILVSRLADELEKRGIKKICVNKNLNKEKNFFSKVNKSAARGEQMLIICPFTFKNAITHVKTYFEGRFLAIKERCSTVYLTYKKLI